jgi:hypothetical protein
VQYPVAQRLRLGPGEAAVQGHLADAIITLRRLIREAWTLYRWDTRPAKRP